MPLLSPVLCAAARSPGVRQGAVDDGALGPQQVSQFRYANITGPDPFAGSERTGGTGRVADRHHGAHMPDRSHRRTSRRDATAGDRQAVHVTRYEAPVGDGERRGRLDEAETAAVPVVYVQRAAALGDRLG